MRITWRVLRQPVLACLIAVGPQSMLIGQKAQSGDKTIEAAGYLAESGRELECSPESSRMWGKKALGTLDGVRTQDSQVRETVNNLRLDSNTKIEEAEKRLSQLTTAASETRSLLKQAKLETAHNALVSVDPKACYAGLKDLRNKTDEGRRSAYLVARQADLLSGQGKRKAAKKLYAKAGKINREYRETLAHSEDVGAAVGSDITPTLSSPLNGGVAGPTLADLRAQATTIVLRDATQVRLSLTKLLSSSTAKAGDSIDFDVLDPVKVGELVVIQRGATATGTVSVAKKKKRGSRGGRLDVTIHFVQLVNGEQAPIRGVKENKGKGHLKGIALSTMIIGPFSPLLFLRHGNDAVIPKNAEITGYIDGDFKLDSQRFVAVATRKDLSLPTRSDPPLPTNRTVPLVGTKRSWKNRAEYDLALKISQTADPKLRLQLINTWTDEYSQTDYIQDRLQSYMVTLNQLAPNDPDARKELLQKAQEMLAVDPNNFTADYYITTWGPAVGGNTPDPALESQVHAAAHGMLDNIDKQFADSRRPANMSADQWAQAKQVATALAHNTLAWEDTAKKDNAAAEEEYKASLIANPNQANVSYAYAKLLMNEKKYSQALYEYARAGNYDGPGALPAGARAQVQAYFTKVYAEYHGSNDGADALVAQAKNSALPSPTEAVTTRVGGDPVRGAQPVDPNQGEENESLIKGWTPLMAAAKAGSTARVIALMQAHVDVNARNELGGTALDVAFANWGNNSCVAALIHEAGGTSKYGTGVLPSSSEVCGTAMEAPPPQVTAKRSPMFALLHCDEFVGTQVRLRIIVVDSKAEAGLILEVLKTGRPFAELARLYSTDNATRDSGGLVGLISVTDLRKEFQVALRGMPAGETTGIVPFVK